MRIGTELRGTKLSVNQFQGLLTNTDKDKRAASHGLTPKNSLIKATLQNHDFKHPNSSIMR